MEPSFSTDEAAGSMKTSVWMSLGLTPGRFQKMEVSVSHRSTVTSHLSLPRPVRALPESGPPTAGFIPMQTSPSSLALAHLVP